MLGERRLLICLKWLPSIGLAAVGLLTNSATQMNWDWYCALNQPPWDKKGNYPTHYFFLVGLALNIGIGVSSYAVWKENGLDGNRLPLGLYGVQLALQWAYLPLLMGCKSIGLSLLDVCLATGAAGAATILFKKINDRTFPLMLPYIVFLSLACVHTSMLYATNLENKEIRSRLHQEEQTH